MSRGARYLFIAYFAFQVKCCSGNDKIRAVRGVSKKGCSSHYLGLRTIEINRIVGTEGRALDFDRSFWPVKERIRERWVSVAIARLMGLSIPEVELVQIEGFYFVRDGHHRISVARALGNERLEAIITVLEVASPLSWEPCPEALVQVGAPVFCAGLAKL